MATDITCEAGKGPRKHRNVSTQRYRAGYDSIDWGREPAKQECDCYPRYPVGICLASHELGWGCSRPHGHTGRHRACIASTNQHNLCEW